MLKENQQIEIAKDDAPKFIEMVNTIMSYLVFQYGIKEVVQVKIKNWFDHKWLNYSGNTVVKFDYDDFTQVESALQPEWREKITIPPFHPNRVISSNYLYKQSTGNKKIKQAIHQYRDSNNNIHNRITNYFTDGIAVWFSSNSLKNQRGSMMAYRVQDGEIHTWYASVENNKGWRITKTKGISSQELNAYLQS